MNSKLNKFIFEFILERRSFLPTGHHPPGPVARWRDVALPGACSIAKRAQRAKLSSGMRAPYSRAPTAKLTPQHGKGR
jgi:hypothetical protein